MKLNSLRELYVKNNISEAELNNAIDLLTLLNKQTELDLDVINQDVLDCIILYLVENDLNTVVNFVRRLEFQPFWVRCRKHAEGIRNTSPSVQGKHDVFTSHYDRDQKVHRGGGALLTYKKSNKWWYVPLETNLYVMLYMYI